MTTNTARPSRRRAETRDRLMAAAVHAFAERGVLGASVEEICEQAGFTRGAFYSNFASKDELVYALLQREASARISDARAAIDAELVAADTAPEARIAATIEVFLASQQTDRDATLAQRELRLYAIRNDDIAAEFVSFDATVRAELTELLESALAAAGCEFSVPTDQGLSLLIAVYEHMMLAALTAPSGAAESGRELITTLLTSITRTVQP